MPGRRHRQVLQRVKKRTDWSALVNRLCGSSANYDLARTRRSNWKSNSADMVSFRAALPVSPQTVQNYLSHLSAIYRIGRPAWGFPLDRQVMKDAFIATKDLGLTSKSRTRDRRPTLDELDRLMEHFGTVKARRPGSIPMQRIIPLAIFSTRRQEEITRIQWTDYESASGDHPPRILIRDMKHPGDKFGNDVRCEVTPEAAAIIAAMPHRDARIFPYESKAISGSFTRACEILGVEDLHFHDLRHEGISRLFEMGRTIPQVASVSGHRSWTSLQRYAHLRQVGDKYAGWKWRSV